MVAVNANWWCSSRSTMTGWEFLHERGHNVMVGGPPRIVTGLTAIIAPELFEWKTGAVAIETVKEHKSQGTPWMGVTMNLDTLLQQESMIARAILLHTAQPLLRSWMDIPFTKQRRDSHAVHLEKAVNGHAGCQGLLPYGKTAVNGSSTRRDLPIPQSTSSESNRRHPWYRRSVLGSCFESFQWPPRSSTDHTFLCRRMGKFFKSGNTTGHEAGSSAPSASLKMPWGARVWQCVWPFERRLFRQKKPQRELVKAIRRGNTRKVLALVKSGVDVDAQIDGEMPLLLASRLGNVDAVSVFLEAGAQLNAVDGRGRTALHWAAESGNRHLVASLVDDGADLDAKDEDGLVALQLAERKGNAGVIDLLGQNGRLSARRALSLASLQRAGSSKWPSHRPEAALDISSISRDFSREVLDTSCNCPYEEDEVTAVPRDAPSEIRRLRIGHMFAGKYRIDSRFLLRKGLSRTAIDAETGQRVNLDFYTDPENLDKSLDLYNRLLESRGVCRLIQKIDAHDGLPDCLVVEQGSLKLNGWIKTPAISGQTKAEALGSIADALKELHGLGIVHADLNPTNITFFPSDRAWKLSNLDSASSAGHKCRPALTSIAYTAPELLEGQNGLSGESECDPSVDMWSFGVIAFEVLTGKKLCETQQLNQESMLEFIRTRNLWRRLNAVQDKSHQRFVKKFLKSDPSSRCTASEARNSSLLWNVSAPGSGSSPWGQEAFSPTQRSPRF